MAKPNAQSGSHRTTLMARKLAVPIEGLLLVSAGIGLAMGSPDFTLWMLVIWVLAALGYLAVAGKRLISAVKSPEQNQILLPTEGKRTGAWGRSFHLDVFVIGSASTMALVSAVMVSRNAELVAYPSLSKIIAAIGILMAWTLLQLGFGRLYADIWHKQDDGEGLEVPGTDEPGLVEFAYFSFGVGTAFSSSDVTITKPHMRMLVTIQAAVSFLYSTVLLAFVVSMIAGS